MDIDVSKENIQPLRGGRNLMQLGAALQAQSDVDAQKQLQQQKEEHEAAIRNYQGTDPLDPWFNYIQWVEQSFPKHGHEGNIDKLVKDCLQLFEKDERYFQDRRLVKLWIKYVDCLSNPLEIYQRLYNTGIGVECSEFYRAWACYCEESGDYKKANQVYMLGLQAKAQPIDELEQAHMNFQLFFAQRMLHDDSPTKRKAASALAETRMALTSLKSFKRRNIANVPVQRVGESIRSTIPGVVKQQPNHYDNRMPNSNVVVNVFEDAPSTSHAIPVVENPGPASLVQACGNVENEKEVGIWTNPKTKMVHTHLVPHQPLPFTPYEDEDDVLRLPAHHVSRCSDDLTFNVPLCVPDPPDPTKIPCYNKTQVYVDDHEYSLEEIRSRKYNLDRKVKTEYSSETKSQQSYQNINETLAQCSALETLANCALDTEHDHLGQLMPLTIPTLQNITKVTNMHSPGEPKVLVNLDSKEFSELSSKKSDEPPRQDDNADKENIGRFASDNYSSDHGAPKNNLMEEFNRSLMGNLLGDSVTVNTKEARWELRNLFNDNEPSMVQPVVQQFEVPNFDIHEDRSMTMALVTKKKVEPMDIRGLPEDKENANKFTVPAAVPTQNVNRTAYYEEPSCTQVFNFNIKDASTPNMSQFKKPTSIDQSKYPNVPKFSMDESVIENLENGAVKKEDSPRQMNTDQHATVDNQGAGLSVIMEATREYNSKSGSTSSSGQSTRTNFTGYTTNFDSMYNHDPSQQPTTSKRSSISSQPRLPSGQFARYPQKREPEKPVPPTATAYSHDHQYQKPVPNNYNGYSPQRSMHTHYQQNFSYQQGYSNNQMMNQQANAYSSPHAAVHSPHAMSPNLPQGFQSPTYSNQVGYHSPVMSPQGSYGRQEYHYPSQTERQQVYAPQQQQSERQQVYAPQQQQSERQQVYAPQQQQSERQQVYGPQQQQSERQQVYAPQQQPERQQVYAPQQQQPERQQVYSPQQQQQQQSERQQVYAPQQQQQPERQQVYSPQQQQPERQQVYSPQQQQQSERQQVYAPQQQTERQQLYAPQQQPERQQVFAPQQQQQSPAAFQSPPHQPQYPNNQYYQRPTQLPAAPNQAYQQTYPNIHNQYNNAYANVNSHPNQNQSFNAMQSPYRQAPKLENSPAAYAIQNNKPFQIYQSPQQPQSYRNAAVQGANMSPETAESQTAQESHAHVMKQQETVANNQNGSKLGPQTKNPAPHKSPTSALRHIRHDQPNAKMNQNSPDVGFSNQFLNFISNRNEPKDNANTPKFTNSPSISQKMHKNLYVSSPEQAQIPPSSGLSDSDSKDGMTAQTGTPIQSAKVAHSMPEKQKDISKRQLDFEHRVDLQSEDSRDSVSKESRISSVYSRHSDIQSDGFGMDVDSENSMECSAFKSTHSISLVETSDIPRPADIDFPKVIDPFNKKIISSLLEYVKFPNKTHAEGYIEVRSVPKLQPATMISIGNNKFSIEKQLGKGNYGAVFLCLDVHSNKSVAVKYQKPSRPWEFYICQEIKARIKDPFMLPGYMDITTAFIGENASLFVSEYSKYGSLLDVANKVRIATSKCINEFIVILLTSEMLSIVHYLHKAQIIHADIKPDNFLLMKIPTQEWRTPSLQLIDLGCAIDMSLFPEGTSFRELIATEGFTCTEMREGKPWTYQTDLYCLAGTIHVILMGSYMKVANRLGQWNIDKKLPRYMKVSLWDKIFTTLLNVQDCNSLPDIMDLKNEVDSVLNEIDNLSSQLRNFANVLKSR